MNHWITAIRPKTLPAAIGPVMVGLALAYQEVSINPLTATLTLLTALFLQISSNLINDYYDGVKGTDNELRLGPKRVTSSGLIKAANVKKAFITTLTLSFIFGLYLMYIGGPVTWLIGLTSLFFSWAYTGGPFPLSYYGLGEVFALIFFGPIAVWGTYYLQTSSLYYRLYEVTFWGISVGLIASALMAINNLRDIEQDIVAHKITLATIIGDVKMRYFIMTIIITQLVLGCILIPSIIGSIVIYLPFLFFRKNWQGILKGASGQSLNNHLAMTGQYLFVFCLFSTIMLVIAK